jgi:hypothetical protein
MTVTGHTNSGATQIYASIKRSSRYHGQQRSKEPFPVEVGGGYDAYIVAGNGNCYRLADLRFYVKLGEKFVALA